MKRWIILAAVLLLSSALYAAFTNPASSIKWNASLTRKNGPLDVWLGETEDYLDGTTAVTAMKFNSLQMTVSDSYQTHTKGRVWYSDANEALEYWNGSAIVTCSASTFAGGNITSDITFSNDGVDILADTTTAHTFAIKARDIDGAAYVDILRWTNGDTAAGVLGSATSSLAIASTGMDVSTAGAVSGVTTLAMGGALSGATTIGASSDITSSGNFIIGTTGTVIAEGTANDHETTLQFTDPTADVIYTFPTGGASTVGVMASTLATNFPDIVNSVTGGSNQIVFEGSTANTSETTIQATNPTADVNWILPDANAAGNFSPMASTLTTNMPGIANSVTGASNQLVFEGATKNSFQATIQATDPTADANYILPDANAAGNFGVMVSALTTNHPGIANSVTGASNGLVFEGATKNSFQATVSSADQTADTTWMLPVAAAGTYGLMSSTLSTNALDAANSVTGGSNQLVFEGATANTEETILQATDPTADITYLLPTGGVGTVSVMSSSLATNYPDIANSVTGGTSQLIFEGSAADAHEHTITATNPTADVVWTLPNATAMTVAFMSTTLATNMPDVATSVTGGTNELIFEGTNEDAHEVHLTAGEAAGDVIYSLPVAAAGTYGVMSSTLAANGVDTATSVTGGTNELVFEGTNLDAHEIHLTAAEATADVLYTLPNAAAGTYGIVTTTLATNALDAANSVWGGTNLIAFEGATADGSEVSLTVTEPNADVTLTLLDYTGAVPAIILQSADDECEIADVTAVDVNGTSIAIADQWCSAGTSIKWTLAGTKTGANGTLMVYLYLDDGIQCTLTSKGNTAGDWRAEIIMHEHTAYATQVITGIFVGADGEVTDFDTDTTDFNDGSATTVKCQLDLSHADDSATCDYVCVEAWKK